MKFGILVALSLSQLMWTSVDAECCKNRQFLGAPTVEEDVAGNYQLVEDVEAPEYCETPCVYRNAAGDLYCFTSREVSLDLPTPPPQSGGGGGGPEETTTEQFIVPDFAPCLDTTDVTPTLASTFEDVLMNNTQTGTGTWSTSYVPMSDKPIRLTMVSSVAI